MLWPMRTTHFVFPLVLLPLFGFSRCSALVGQDAAPDVQGDWAVTYDDTLDVTIEIGGATYTSEFGVQGGSVTIDHEGQPFTFELDCGDDAVQCPSEVWPETVALDQREGTYPHRVWMTVPGQACETEPVAPDPDECGEDTNNPDCLEVCEGELLEEDQDVFGLISDDGSEFELYLGAGVATNGINCALLGLSRATGGLINAGVPEDGDWTAESIVDGVVTTAYAGGCLWADDVDGDEELEALVLAASITIESGYVAERIPAPAKSR
jgi:hypothetical protein